MNLRIVAGKYGGRTIKSPSGHLTHPMGERIRGSLFNILSENINGAVVLDAFAGTGSLGLEAMSRGAKCVTFVEKDKLASAILKENIELLGLSDDVMTFKMGVSSWIDTNSSDKYDIIFADPPYGDMQFSTVEKLHKLLSVDGVMAVSYPTKIGAPVLECLSMTDNRNYGDASIAFFKKNH